MYPHTIDCFISYSDDFIVKEEKLSDSDPQLPKPYPSNDQFPTFISPKKTRSESFAEVTIQKLVSMDFLASVNKKRPFRIIRGPTRSQADEIKVKIEPEKKLMGNNRKARRRRSVKKEEDSSQIIVKKEAGICDEESEISSGSKEHEGQSQKKMVQMIRNRISAQNSRDRRKAQLKALEDGKDEMSVQNKRLWDEKKGLLKEIKKLEQSNQKLLEEKERLLKKKKKGSFTCVNCSGKGAAKAAQAGFSLGDLESLWKNMETMGLVGQEDYFRLSEEQKEIGYSIGMTLGMAMMECMKGGPNNEGSKKGTSNGSKRTTCSMFQEKEHEEEEMEFGRKFSRSTLASPNLSSLTHSSFLSEDYELNKPALTSFWETISSGNRKSGNDEEEEKAMGNREKKIWIDFQNKVMKENVMDGGSWKQRTSPLAKGGSVRLLNCQDF